MRHSLKFILLFIVSILFYHPSINAQIITTIAGSDSSGFSGDGAAATAARLNTPASVAADKKGNIYILDNERVRKINSLGVISTFAGNGSIIDTPNGDGGAATNACLGGALFVSLDDSGDVYISSLSKVRKVSIASGIIKSVAGQNHTGFSGDGGTATAAHLNWPGKLAIDTNGDIYIPDYFNNRIRKVSKSTGKITTIAGTGIGSFSGDGGQATAATFDGPTAVLKDNMGNLLISDRGNTRIRIITTSGIISTFAGTGGGAYTGDGGPATAATFSSESLGGLALDKEDNVYISDVENNCIRKINTCGVITTIAGNGIAGFAGDNGAANVAMLNYTADVAVDTNNQIYITDLYNNRIRKVTQPYINSIYGNSVICLGSTSTLGICITGGTWSSTFPSVATISNSGIVYGVAIGTDTIKYTTDTSFVYQIITVNPLPNRGVIFGDSTLCINATTTFTDSGSIGINTWSLINNYAMDTVLLNAVTGISIGIDTIEYKVTNACGVDSILFPITINPLPSAGTITGASNFCIGGTDTFKDTTATGTGTWNLVNGKATIIALPNIVSGISSGLDTILYIVNNSCGSDTAKKAFLIKSLPHVSTITNTILGFDSICVTAHLSLFDSVLGGMWSLSNTHAIIQVDTTVSILGGKIILGVTAGWDTAQYKLTNSCGMDSAMYIFQIKPQPYHGTLTGSGSVCINATDTFGVLGAIGLGTWSLVNNFATDSVLPNVIKGWSAGTDTLKYRVTNSCGVDSSLTPITINPLPAISHIIGLNHLCIGEIDTLRDSIGGGLWSAMNINATVAPTSGVVTGITAGTDNITYTKSNGCGSITANITLTIIPFVHADSISGPNAVCVGSIITLSDSTVGGIWHLTNNHAIDTTYMNRVTGLSAGLDTILYIVSNMCNADTSFKAFIVNPLPFAGTIMGDSFVCQSSTDTLRDSLTSGTWSASNAHVHINTTTGIVTGLLAGIDTIKYRLTNMCGSDSTFKVITVNPLPLLGTIKSDDSVCIGNSLTLFDSTFSYVSSISYGVTDTVLANLWKDTLDGIYAIGLINTNHVGQDSVFLKVANSCSSAIGYKTFYINPLPSSGIITGLDTFCAGIEVILSDTVSGGAWYTSSASIATISNTGVVIGLNSGHDQIVYQVHNSCGWDTTTHSIYIKTAPPSPILNGFNTVCTGRQPVYDTFYASPVGGTFSVTNDNISLNGGIATGINPGLDTIIYTITNSCGSSNVSRLITVYTTWQCDSAAATPILTMNEGIKIYPNPANNIVTVEYSSKIEEFQVALIDMYGKVITINEISNTKNPKVTFDIQNLLSGNYILMVKADGKIYRDQLVVVGNR